jgi:hypothetical protein
MISVRAVVLLQTSVPFAYYNSLKYQFSASSNFLVIDFNYGLSFTTPVISLISSAKPLQPYAVMLDSMLIVIVDN